MINGHEIVPLGKSSELAIKICLTNFSSLNIKEVTKQRFHNDFTAKNGGFITILLPKTAINNYKIVTLGKSSELAIQICLKNFSSLNIKEVTKQQFHNDFTAKNGYFITILLPKTAINSYEKVTLGKW